MIYFVHWVLMKVRVKLLNFFASKQFCMKTPLDRIFSCSIYSNELNQKKNTGSTLAYVCVFFSQWCQEFNEAKFSSSEIHRNENRPKEISIFRWAFTRFILFVCFFFCLLVRNQKQNTLFHINRLHNHLYPLNVQTNNNES